MDERIYKYASVVGSDDVVRLGTTDEYRYFRVFHRATSDDIGTSKRFYESPEYVPGYEKWIKDPNMQRIVKEWRMRRNRYL